MLKLIKLELRRNNLHTFIVSSIIITFVMFGLFLLFAYIPKLEPNDSDLVFFSGYDNLIPLFSVVNMTVFCVLSSIMYCKFVIEDYSGKRPILLFSYPISRKKIFLSKLCIVNMFTILTLILSNFLIFLIFGILEKILILINQPFTFSTMLWAIKITFVMSLIATSISTVSLGLGFVKKSVPTTIVSAVIISSLMCNIVASTSSNISALYVFASIMILASIIITIVLLQKINSMEVE
jgi:hypothetical protein